MLEISNYTISGQPLEPGKETKTGEAQIRAPKSGQETGKAITTLTGIENASTYDITDTARLVQQADAAISKMPVVDINRVSAAKARIQSLLTNSENIAQKIMRFESQLPNIVEGD
jgi:anti-sigma28 factor (negative regulator of flagellin synthesis)